MVCYAYHCHGKNKWNLFSNYLMFCFHVEKVCKQALIICKLLNDNNCNFYIAVHNEYRPKLSNCKIEHNYILKVKTYILKNNTLLKSNFSAVHLWYIKVSGYIYTSCFLHNIFSKRRKLLVCFLQWRSSLKNKVCSYR